MSIERWSRWSHPEADPYGWLLDWLQTQPGAGAALVGLAEPDDVHGRLLCVGSDPTAMQVLTASPWMPEAAPVVSDANFRRWIATAESSTLVWPVPPNRPPWLAQVGGHVRALPLVHDGRVAFWLFLTASPAILQTVDLAQINLGAAFGLGGARLRHVQSQHRRGSAAVAGLAEVQRLLQPDRPRIAGLDYALHWQPAETAAGDYYDLMALTHVYGEAYDPRFGDVWGVMVGDVSGHGAAAAMEAVQFDAILRTYKPDEDAGPAGALSYANRYFLSRRSRQRFMTVLAAGYRPDLGQLRYANAGHLPLLLRRGGKVEVHGDGDMPLGVLRDTVYRNQTLSLRAGDLIIMATDGIIEARDDSGREFGTERLLAMVEQGPRRPQALLNSLLEALFRHQGGRIGRDDQTLVVLGIQAAHPEPPASGSPPALPG